MSRAGGVFRIDPSTGMKPVCYYAARHYYVRCTPVYYSPNSPKRNVAMA